MNIISELKKYSISIFIILFSIIACAEIKDLPEGYEYNKETNELRFTGKVKNIIHECSSDKLCAVYIDDVVVLYGRTMRSDEKVIGKVFWEEIDYRLYFDSYIGRYANVFCKIEEDWRPPKHTGIVCSLRGKYEYFVKFK